jgi:hypothetical protein
MQQRRETDAVFLRSLAGVWSLLIDLDRRLAVHRSVEENEVAIDRESRLGAAVYPLIDLELFFYVSYVS